MRPDHFHHRVRAGDGGRGPARLGDPERLLPGAGLRHPAQRKTKIRAADPQLAEFEKHIHAPAASLRRTQWCEMVWAQMNATLRALAANSMRRRSAVRLLVLVAVLPLGTSLRSVAARPVPLAIKGYDPVAYFAVGKPMRGLPEIEYEWNGYRYRFSRAEHRELFKADPKYYAPQFENYCAMALAKGALVEADPENWLINEGRLYIFGKPAPAGPALFQKDLAGNIAKANQNRSLIPKH